VLVFHSFITLQMSTDSPSSFTIRFSRKCAMSDNRCQLHVGDVSDCPHSQTVVRVMCPNHPYRNFLVSFFETVKGFNLSPIYFNQFILLYQL